MRDKKSGFLVSFEGIDASGKNTQSRMLFDYLKEKGMGAKYLSFPDYSTPIGQEIMNFLSGKREYNPESRHLLYAVNRYEHKESIENWVSEGQIVVINRYSESNLAYGGANGLSLEWLLQIESLMPRSDYVFYLRLEPEISKARKLNRDRYETDLGFLKRVSEVYEALAERGRWFAINADGPKDLIHYEIVKLLSSLMLDKSNVNPEAELSLGNRTLTKSRQHDLRE